MKKILFIDDEKDLHDVMTEFFPRDQYRLICAHDGYEGLQKCKNESFDFIITDYRMPKVDGAKFVRQLRELQEIAKSELTPVLFLSGCLDELRALNLKIEKAEYLAKPFTKEDIFEKMGKFNKDKTKPVAATIKPESKITLNAGEVLFKEGDEADCVYFVMSGSMDGTRKGSNGTISVGKINAGEIIGEMAILNQEKRILTVTALEKTEVVMIPADKILAIVNSQPKWIKIMIETLSKRLRNTIKQMP